MPVECARLLLVPACGFGRIAHDVTWYRKQAANAFEQAYLL